MTPEAKAYCEAQARRIAELEAELSAYKQIAVDAATECNELRKYACALWKALNDLSFHCDGVTWTVAPPREIYNATFYVMNDLRSKYDV